jgi:hypothetical protein
MMMTWAVSYFSVTPETAQDIASSALDEIGGEIGDLAPAEVMNTVMREYFRRSENGNVVIEEIPGWTEHGFVRPAQIQEKNAFIGDETYVFSNHLGSVLSTEIVPPGVADDYHGVTPDGSLILKSGGTIPPLSSEDREKVWVAVFCDPVGTDQDKIDQLVADPPPIPENPNFVEQSAIDAYQHVVENALMVAESIDSGQGHNH